jgi:hypothetical protein
MSEHTDQLVRDIDDVVTDVFDLADRRRAKERAGSRRDAYEKGLTEVQRIAGKPQATRLAEWIQSQMREREAFPSAREVRKQGARICRESGHEVSTSSWLGA